MQEILTHLAGPVFGAHVKRIGKTHTYVQKCESGDRQINPIDLRDVCLALGVSFVDFLKEIDEALMEQERAASLASLTGNPLMLSCFNSWAGMRTAVVSCR